MTARSCSTRRRIGAWPLGSPSCCTAISRSSSPRWAACRRRPRCRSRSRPPAATGCTPALGLPPQALAPVLDALAAQTRAFGVNFFPAVMDRGSLELAAERAPYVDFFLADADAALVEIVHAGGGVCGWQVESGEEARAAEAAGCDLVDRQGLGVGRAQAHRGAGAAAAARRGARRRRRAGRRRRWDRDRARGRRRVRGRRGGGARRHALHRRHRVRGASGVGAGGARRPAPATRWSATPSTSGMPEPGPHRVLRSSIEAAEALDHRAGGRAADRRARRSRSRASARSRRPATRPARSGRCRSTPGQSAGAVHAIQPAAEIVAELASGVPG